MSPRPRAFVFALVLLAPGLPRAAMQAAAPDAKAKRLEMSALYDAGDVRGALKALDEAHALAPLPSDAYNYGAIYDELGRHVEALEAYERFLATTSEADRQLAEKRQEAASSREALLARVGHVEVVSNVPGADVVLDDRPAGVTPLAKPIRVMPGRHQLLVRKGIRQHVHTFEARAGERLRLEAKLPEAPAELRAAPAASTAPLAPKPASDQPETAFYRRPWFWGVVAAAVAGGVVGLALAGQKRGDEICPGGCDRGPYKISP